MFSFSGFRLTWSLCADRTAFRAAQWLPYCHPAKVLALAEGCLAGPLGGALTCNLINNEKQFIKIYDKRNQLCIVSPLVSLQVIGYMRVLACQLARQLVQTIYSSRYLGEFVQAVLTRHLAHLAGVIVQVTNRALGRSLFLMCYCFCL